MKLKEMLFMGQALSLYAYCFYLPQTSSAKPMTTSTETCEYTQEIDRLTVEHNTMMEITEVSAFRSNLTWSPDGKYLAAEDSSWGNNPYRIEIFDPRANQVILQTEVQSQEILIPQRQEAFMAWSPDSRYLAVVPKSNGSPIKIFDIVRKEIKTREQNPDISIGGKIKWSPDSRYFAFVDTSAGSLERQGNVQVISLAVSEPPLLIKYDAQVYDIAWSPDGNAIATTGLEGFVIVTTVSGANLQTTLEISPTQSNEAGIIYWLHDDRIITVSFFNLLIAHRLTGEIIEKPLNSSPPYLLSPNQKYLTLRTVISCRDTAEIDPNTTQVINLETDEVMLETPYGSTNADEIQHRIAWSPNNQYLAINDNPLGMYVYSIHDGNLVFSGRMLGDPSGLPFEVTAFGWSPDGQYIALAGQDNNLRIIEVATRREVGLIQLNARVWPILWSPDGRRIAVIDDKLRMIELEE